MEGSSMVVCGAKSSWEPSIPQCLKGTKVVLFSFFIFLAFFFFLFSLLVFKFISLMLNIMIPEKRFCTHLKPLPYVYKIVLLWSVFVLFSRNFSF